MKKSLLFALIFAVTSLVSVAAIAATDFEIPRDESPAASLPPGQLNGENFHIQDPVHSDGLMHRYVVDSRFGVFDAYGPDALTVRIREVAALTTISETSKVTVVLRSVARGIQNDAKSVVRVASNPVGTVLGIPTGIKHLLSGYEATASDAKAQTQKTLSGSGAGSARGVASRATSQAAELAKQYADQYLGLSAAQRRWYAELGVDPYTNNEVLRRAVNRLAQVDAAANLGMHFAPIGIAFAGDMTRALDTIYTEDPAVLRNRRRQALVSYGLSPEEIERFENTLLLNPTRQTLLVDAVKALDGVEGRAELLRHAAEVKSEVEIEVFVQSTALLVRFHAGRPLVRIIPGLRIPSGQLADGTVVVFGAFDAVQWTEDVAVYERTIRAALPGNSGREIWFTGSVSPRARTELERLGWAVRSAAFLPGR
jgi:hypothetical protein